MSRNKVVKIFILLLVLSLIIIQTCTVGAMTIDQILGEGNETSNLQQTNTSTELFNTTGNTATNTANTTPITSITNNTTNTNKTLPKTGTNENIIIGLMIVCTIAGIYAFKKVKDYNM